MRLFQNMAISASALTAERLKMDLAANNIANYNTTGYRRKVAVQAERPGDFQRTLEQALGVQGLSAVGQGVRITEIVEDPSPLRVEFDPAHPDADEQGYVQKSNVDPLTEIVDLMMAQRAYEANVTALNAAKSMALKALEIGK